MKRRRLLFYICTGLIFLFLFQIGCNKDECTKLVKRARYRSNTFKSVSSKSSYAVGEFIPHNRSTPYWMDWVGRNLDLDNLSGQYYAGCGVNPDGSYNVEVWIGFQGTITIPEGQTLLMRSVNCVIQGDIRGSGTLIFESYQAGKSYDCPIGAILVVDGVIDNTVNLVLHDNATTEILGGTLDNDTPKFNDWETLEVDCSMELPHIWRDPDTGITWWYEEA